MARRAVRRRARRLLSGARRRRANLLVAVLAAVTAIVLGGGGMAVFAYLDATYGTLPDTRTLSADSMVYDRSGALLADLHPGGETRIPVPLAQVAAPAQQAVVAVEDRNFWQEGAIDTGRIVSAAWQDVVHHDTQGASTITEQLAKVLYLGAGEHGIAYKLHEVFLARRLDQTLSKTQILEDYLNDVPFGHGTVGIEAAARTFFGVPAARLDTAQAALLAGLPNAPALLDPFSHMAAARARQGVVLDAMVSSGVLSRAAAVAAAAEPLQLAPGDADNVDRYPAFAQRVARDVSARLHLDPYRAGLRITTTLDSGLQDSAQATVTNQVAQLRGLQVSDGALVAVDPASGQVLAYVGSAGPSFPAWQIDMASVPRQPGSTFKLFTYATALAEHKVTMSTPIVDAPLTLPRGGGSHGDQPYDVHNYDLKYHGTLPVKETFANSLNIPAVKVELLAGVANVVRTAQAMGVTTLTQPPSSYGASLTLGTYAVPLWEMAQTGSVFAAGGVLHPATELLSVKDGGGRELLSAPAAARQALDPGVAFIVNDILRTDANRVLEFGAGSDLTVDGHLVAAKTGTTQDFRDNLTVGWTPHLAVATWVGNASDAPMHGTTGLTGAAPIWHAVISRAIARQNDDWPSPPGDVVPGAEGDYLLAGTDAQTGATSNVRYAGSCRYWDYNGAHYWFCGDSGSGLPGDPGSQGGGAAPTPTPPPGDLPPGAPVAPGAAPHRKHHG